MENRHHFGNGFAVRESLKPHISQFNPVSERIAVLRINTTVLNIVIIICVHEPTEVSLVTDKVAFYEDLGRVYYNKTPGNLTKVVLGDLNAMCEKEIQYHPTTEKESMHDSSNDNGLLRHLKI